MDRRIVRAGVLALFCSLCSVALGYLLVGGRIFQPDLVAFQFVMSGALVGLFLAARVWLSAWRTMLLALGAFVLIILVLKVDDPHRRVSYAVYVAILYLGATGGLACDRLFPRLPVGKFMVWSALFGLLHLASVPFLGWALSHPPEPGLTLAAARLGAAVGAATGLAYELSALMGATLKDPPIS